jgi:hypothetical protein
VRRALVLAALALSALASACGTERQRPRNPDEPVRPGTFSRAYYPASGLTFEAPRNWPRDSGNPPLVVTVSSGRATVAVWRYPRREELPTTSERLRPLVKALVEAATARDPGLRIRSSRIVKVAGAPGIELVGTASVSGQPRSVRSVHLFDRKAEIVVDAYAPARNFDELNRTVFRRVISSLALSAPIAPREPGGQGQQGGRRGP